MIGAAGDDATVRAMAAGQMVALARLQGGELSPVRVFNLLKLTSEQVWQTATMSITQERKQDLISEFATATGDTGSPEVQVAVLPSGSPT